MGLRPVAVRPFPAIFDAAELDLLVYQSLGVGVGAIVVVHPVDSLDPKDTGQIQDCVLHFHDLYLGVKYFVTIGLVVLLPWRMRCPLREHLTSGDHFCDKTAPRMALGW